MLIFRGASSLTPLKTNGWNLKITKNNEKEDHLNHAPPVLSSSRQFSRVYICISNTEREGTISLCLSADICENYLESRGDVFFCAGTFDPILTCEQIFIHGGGHTKTIQLVIQPWSCWTSHSER